MAATENLRQLAPSHNSRPELIAPRHGVVTLSGYGIQVRVDRGHLLLEDGIGTDRRCVRLPRVGHGLKRLVVIGSDGMVSLAALRWLADQDTAFSMLERDGKACRHRPGSSLRCQTPSRSGSRTFIRGCLANHARTYHPKARRTGTGCTSQAARFRNGERNRSI